MPKEDLLPTEQTTNTEKSELDLALGLFDIEKVNLAISAFSTSAKEIGLNLLEARHVFKALFVSSSSLLADKLNMTLEELDTTSYGETRQGEDMSSTEQLTDGGDK